MQLQQGWFCVLKCVTPQYVGTGVAQLGPGLQAVG